MKEKKNFTSEEEELWFSAVTKEELGKYDKDAAYAAFRQRIAKTSHHKRSQWLRYAAAAAVLVAVAMLGYKGGQTRLESGFGDIVVEAPMGSRLQTTLPDGTKVWLNAGSRMSYSQGFSLKNRQVMIVGEGYFEVAHNKDLPFCVKADDVNVKVLGTKFNLRDYPNDAEAIVSLTEGSVALNSTKASAEEHRLKPGQRATLDKLTGKICIEDYEVSNSMLWTNGQLVFDGQPFGEIIKMLARSYNVEIEVTNDKLYDLRFYGEFIRQEQSLQEVLDALVATSKIKYEHRGKKIILF